MTRVLRGVPTPEHGPQRQPPHDAYAGRGWHQGRDEPPGDASIVSICTPLTTLNRTRDRRRSCNAELKGCHCQRLRPVRQDNYWRPRAFSASAAARDDGHL